MRAIAKTALPILALLLVSPWATTPLRAQDEKPSVDDQLTKLAAVKKQKADLLKQVAELDKTAAALVLEIQDQLRQLGRRLEEINGTPLPPGPTPPGPVNPPADPLKARIRAAYDADPGSPADKRQWAIELSGYYSAAVESKLADDRTITTAGQLIERIRKTTTLDRTKLTGARTVAAQEIAAVLGTIDTPLDDAKRKAVTTLFQRIESAFDEVTK